MKPPFLRAAAVALALLFVAAACGGDDDAGAKQPSGSSTSTTAAAPPVAPLTGLPDPTGVAQTRPVLSIKIDDLASVRPQSGLEAADIVWNEVVEGGITRFLAMFQSTNTDVVGPVRSVRRTDPAIVWPVGGIFVYSGGARGAVEMIQAAPVTLVDEDRAGDAMFRDRSRSAPHNLFARPDRLWAIGGEPAPPPALFGYAAPKAKKPAGATPVTGATIAYRGDYAVSYTWDATSASWLRSTGGRPFVTRDGRQLATQNVVVLKVEYAGGVGNDGAEAQLVGQGSAVVLRDGTATEATWERSAESEPIRLMAKGKPVKLVPGRTWVELPDSSYAVDVAAVPTPPSS